MKEKTWLDDVLFYIFILIGILIIVIFQGSKRESDDIKIVGVDVKGAVNAPGYYELENGSRVKDAIKAAGGEQKIADLSEINMARRLIDGEEIIVPTVNNPDAVVNAEYDKGESSENINAININTADVVKLCELEGIGEATASDIIEYRMKNGPFKSIDDIKNVNGIGSAKFEKIKNHITV